MAEHLNMVDGRYMMKCVYCGQFVPWNPSYDWRRFCRKECKALWWNASRISRTTKESISKLQSLCAEEGITALELETVIGTVLGDASISKSKEGRRSSLSFGHCTRHEAYLRWKISEMGNLFGPDSPVRQYAPSQNMIRGEVIHGTGHFTTRSRPSLVLGFLRALFYRNWNGKGAKSVPRTILPLMGARAVAIWFMDDGAGGSGKRKDIKFATDSFRHNDVIRLQTRLFHLGIESTLYMSRGIHPRINISGANIGRFVDLVEPHIHPVMRYKIEQGAFPAD